MPVSVDQLEKELDRLLEEALGALGAAQEPQAIEAVRIEYLGRKGKVTQAFSVLRDPKFPSDQKSRAGAKLNQVKKQIEAAIQQGSPPALAGAGPKKTGFQDLTLPGQVPAGHHTPLRAGDPSWTILSVEMMPG